MKTNIAILVSVLTLVSLVYPAHPPGKGESDRAGASPTVVTPRVRSSAEADALRLHGEERFRANCGRCHAAPQKFPLRMMATIVRHMRVRATITDEDMRLVLFYMRQ